MADQEPENISAEGERCEMVPSDSEARYQLLFESNPIPSFVYDLETLRFIAVNKAAIRHYGYSQEEFYDMTVKEIRPAEDIPILVDKVSRVKEGADTVSSNYRHKKKDGTIIYVEITARAFRYAGRLAELALVQDITERVLAEEERERLIQELTEALARVKTLSGMLPMCSSCKKIRDDEGYWNQIEVYIGDHSEAEFSHGICPPCAKGLYPKHYAKLFPEEQ